MVLAHRPIARKVTGVALKSSGQFATEPRHAARQAPDKAASSDPHGFSEAPSPGPVPSWWQRTDILSEPTAIAPCRVTPIRRTAAISNIENRTRVMRKRHHPIEPRAI